MIGLKRGRAGAIVVGLLIATSVAAPIWANHEDGIRRSRTVRTLNTHQHELDAENAALTAQVAQERADVRRLCASAQANRQVIRQLVQTGNGARLLQSIDTAKIAATEPYLAAVINALNVQMAATERGVQQIVSQPIPCATPAAP